jgi:formylglycine-generating enzyme required for sulfatase activity
MQDLMIRMKAMTAKPLSSFDGVWKPIPQHLVEISSTKATSNSPEGMIKIPAASFVFKVRGIEIEGSNDVEVDVQYPWEDMPRRFHEHKMEIKPFYVDKYPVTNAEFKKFLDASNYHPQNDLNFLRDWKNGTYPDGRANVPVTWVSLEDARAYAKWAGKRLPHEWEWQYAAQGTDDRAYPWGNSWKADAVPTPSHDRVLNEPDNVGAHPSGASPVRCYGYGGQCMAMDRRVHRRTYAGRHSAGWKSLSTPRVHLVFSAGLSQRRTRQATDDGSQL